MRIDDLNEPPEAQIARRLKRQEAADPIGHSSVTRGQLRIASDEGLLVEGKATVTGQLIGQRDGSNNSARMLWDGDARFKWNVSVGNQLMSEKTTFLLGESWIGVAEASSGIPAGKVTFGGDIYPAGAWHPEYRSSAVGARVLCIDPVTGAMFMAPWSASGGDGPGGGPYTGGWPRSPFSWDSFSLNNLDGESDYGPRNTGKGWHDGIDYSGSGVTYGSVITAVGPGVTIGTGYVDGWGGYQGVIIKHDQIDQGSLAGKQLFSVYAHCQTRYVEPGTRVDTGTPIAEVGNEGQSLGAHLHLELHIGSLYMYGDPGVGGSQDPVPIFNEYGGWP